jgi:hypothetical protein
MFWAVSNPVLRAFRMIMSNRDAAVVVAGWIPRIGAAPAADCVVWPGCDVRQAGAGLAKDLISGLPSGWSRTSPWAGAFYGGAVVARPAPGRRGDWVERL